MPTKAFCAIATLLLAVIFSVNTSAQNTVVGSIPAEFNVENGVANYAIPIDIAPGRGGMQPDLSLNYSSDGGNGILGMGWSLGGLSAIHRCPATIAQDGFVGGINFDVDDRYCLDGQRLIPISNNEFRTELDGYSSIRAVGGTLVIDRTNGSYLTNPEYFVVKTKAGQLITYGGSGNASHQFPQGVMNWSIREINDTTGNNPITYDYFIDQNSQYLDKITYPGGSVNVVYDEVERPDQVPGYFLGSEITLAKRIEKIATYANGNFVQEYKINYQNNNFREISQITEINSCDAGGNCSPPISFDWESATMGFSSTADMGSEADVRSHRFHKAADINGDGLTDICSTAGVGRNEVKCYTGGSNGYDVENRSIESSFLDYRFATSNTISFSDFNGDGLTDLCLRLQRADADNASYNPVCILSLGDSFGEVIHAPELNLPNSARYWIDFNNDGLTDFCWLPRDGGNAHLGCILSNGTSFGNIINSSISARSAYGFHEWFDINGDSLPDFCQSPDGSNHIECTLSTGTSFGETVVYHLNTNPEKVSWTDFNGDGLVDYCQLIGNQNLVNSRVQCTLSTGTGFGEVITSDVLDWGTNISVYGSNLPNEKYNNWVDINSDGFSDYCRPTSDSNKTDGQQRICTLSTGTGFGQTFTTDNYYLYGSPLEGVIDFNGDGLVDFCEKKRTYDPDVNAFQCIPSNFNAPLKINKITDSRGNTTSINYHPLTDATVYTKGSGAIYPVQDVQNARYVVRQVETSNGVGSSNTVVYHYEGLKRHLKGRGSYGYSKITETYLDSGKTTVTTFDQRDFPYTGNILSVVESLNGNTINQSNNTFIATENALGIYQLHLKELVQNSYELGDSNQPITTVTTTYDDIDSYGNIGRVTVATTDGNQIFTQITESSYTNNTNDWILGRLSDTTVTHQSPYGEPDLRRSEFTYDATTGLLLTESVTNATDTEVLATTTYTYDQYGQQTAMRLSTSGETDRVSSTAYNNQGQMTQSCNALNQCETYTYTPQGWLNSTTGPNNITTTWSYDGFGRKIREDRADGTWSTTHYYFASSGQCGDLVSHSNMSESPVYSCTVTQTSGSQPAIIQYDKLGRELRTIKHGFDGRLIYSDTEYNHLAQVARTSRDYYVGDVIYWATSEYDALDRVTRVTEPGPHGSTTEVITEYNGLTTTIKAGPDNRTKTVLTNAIGQKVRIDEEEGSYTEYTYNSDGNLLTTRVAGDNDTIIRLSYDEFGRKDTMDDPDMGRWQYTYNGFGELTQQKDAKNQTVTMEYDRLGRMIRRSEPEGVSTWTYGDANSSTPAPPGSIGKLLQETGNGLTKDYSYDNLGRPVSTTTTIAGQGSFTSEVEYDNQGRIKRTVYPGSQNFYTENQYNQNGFLEAVTGLRSHAEVHNYSKLQPLITEATTLADDYLAKANALKSKGEYYQSQIAFYQSLSGSGSINSTLRSELTQHRVSLNTTVAQGQSVGIKTNVSQFIPIMLDGLLIPIIHQQKSVILQPELLSHINNAVVELQTVNELITTQAQSYQAIAEQLIVLAEQSLATADHNFQFVRTLDHSADAYSELISEQSTNTITYWRAVDVDASGRISAEVYGNGIVNDYAYNQGTGQLQSIHSSLLAVDAIRHLEYQYDAYQSVTLRDDLVNDIRETYEYDRLDRLTATQVSSNLYDSADFNNTQSLTYDVLGNITHKSDVGSYTYGAGAAGPHAVTRAGGKNYNYDANGNMISGDGRTIQYNSFNKPTQITQNGRSATFSYGPSRARFKKVNHQGDTTLYVGSLYERLSKNSGGMDQKHYIYAAGQLVAEHIVSSAEGTQTRYLHKDALGSVDLVTDAHANVVDRRSFDAWGKLRNLPWQSQAGLDDPLYLTQLPYTNKGYTGHENVQEVGLIHMNGRMYDATLARFINADPLIQADSMSQSYNRYSYVMNNPMKYTDPSGYSWISKTWKKFKKSSKKAWNKVRPYVGMIVGAVVSIYCTVCGGAVSTAIIAGAAAGAAGAAATGGDVLKGAATGALSGALFGAIGASGLGSTARILAHGVAGGVMSVIQGGKFGYGFMSSAFTKYATLQFTSAGYFNMSNQSMTRVLGRTTVAAVIGGTASEIGGGKFANGAKTAAMAHLFNGELSVLRDKNGNYKKLTFMDKLKGSIGVLKRVDYSSEMANFARDEIALDDKTRAAYGDLSLYAAAGSLTPCSALCTATALTLDGVLLADSIIFKQDMNMTLKTLAPYAVEHLMGRAAIVSGMPYRFGKKAATASSVWMQYEIRENDHSQK